MSEDTIIAPVTKEARVASLDVLRGIAVLGILMMNITAFGLLPQAYVNPTVEGGADGANRIAFAVIMVLFEGTMRGIFSLLFGASIVLLTERMERAGAGIMAAEIHFRRMLWMLLLGILHWTVLLWWGEILFNYAMCGLLLFSVRKLRPGILLTVAVLLLAGAALFQTYRYDRTVEKQRAAAEAEAVKAGGAKLTEAQTRAIEAWRNHARGVVPTPEDAANSRRWHGGSYLGALGGQLSMSYELQWTDAPYWLLLDLIPFMLIGMALIHLGLLGATAPPRTYALMVLVGYGVGIPLGIHELNLLLDSHFAILSFAAADRSYEISRLAMVVGHLGLALLVIRAGLFGMAQRALAAIGQMALSNYVAQTIICTILFYGFGFGLFGKLQRYELYYVVAAIWAAQLIWSPLWLRFYRFGPLEWLWRTLTYWKPQPMRV
jgi:uncharacterized protein